MKKINLTIFVIILSGFCFPLLSQENKLIVKTEEGKDTISKYIYGHFAEHLGRCIYDGIWVGEDSPIPNTRGLRNDVIEALKGINLPVLRWPGGCFADSYHWKDGIGPKENRPPIVNMFWGNVTEDNSFGTHEFLDLCEILGTEPYIAVNVGSGTVKEASEWVEYVTSDNDNPMSRLRKQNGREQPWKVKFWGIGNENWGCGGNMDASYYASLYKRYATYCRAEYRIASGGLNDDPAWTETVMNSTKNHQDLIQGYSYHHYTVCNTWEKKGSATNFDENEWFKTISKNFQMEENLKEHMAIMDKYDPDKKIGLYADEWGNWHDVEPGTNPGFLYQQNTLRDALTASIYLNIFNNHCDRVKMANIAQTVNVLQAMILTEGSKMIKTPSFYVFKMYKVHHDALLMPLEITCEDYVLNNQRIPALSASASKNKEGQINITIANVNPEKSIPTDLTIDNEKYRVTGSEIITADKMNAYNDFDKDEMVYIQEFKSYKQKGNNIQVTLPSKSVVLLTLSEK
ncbi:MAG: alpha-N-arabinofuranosidase [Bacteroidales bacterium]|nr:alpha-N-arabinofuranosidase [Bacteroidales bacterium]